MRSHHDTELVPYALFCDINNVRYRKNPIRKEDRLN